MHAPSSVTLPPLFHPAVAAWFGRQFAGPTAAQAQAWPAIKAGRHTLVAAPTGSGKTLAAFLAAIDDLVRQGLAGALPDETQVVYVSPLKALSNDIHRNLEAPLAGIAKELRRAGLPDVEIRTWVRTGDTSPAERARMRKRPPHILVTTPESLYVLLGSVTGRAMLTTTRTVIVDEIHAVAPNKRGAHLALSLERLAALAGDHLLRIGLSATQNPVSAVADFLVGAGADDASDTASGRRAKPPNGCASSDESPAPGPVIIDTGHQRERDLAIEVPASPLEAVMSAEVWLEVYGRLVELINAHRTTLVFVNTRRMAERVARALSERLGEGEHDPEKWEPVFGKGSCSNQKVTAHHGSMAKEHRLAAERALKHGKLKALVATASLELGIDIGDVDLACQLGSPRSIAAFLQRVGRSGHAVDGTPKGRLFPLSRDDLVECAALIDSVRRSELDRLTIPQLPLDVLAQQIAAEVAAQDWAEDALYARFRRAHPFRNLARADFDAVVTMLADGFAGRFGRRGALVHRDAVHGMLRARRGARTTALTSGGTIPDTADYQVLLEPESHIIGSVNEDFAVESLAGDIFQLGNASYRIIRVERGTVRVEDAHGEPPTLPFWLGEAPGRTDELSASVSRLRGEIFARLKQPSWPGNSALKTRVNALSSRPSTSVTRRGLKDVDARDERGHDDRGGEERERGGALTGRAAAVRWLTAEVGLAEAAADQLVDYLAAAAAALGAMPTHDTVVLERFFDEAGGMQLVVHAPFGSRINRAWGLALRKRFCRKFNFELQAAATEDSIVLSLTTAHSFELAEVARYLNSASVRAVLIQAMLDAPMFTTRWRWVAGVALALPRFRGGRKVAPQIMRMQAEDLIAAVFPDQIACAENLTGEREVPDHPLTNQAIADCLTEAMDIAGLERLLQRIESGAVRIVARDLTEPSPLALEVLSARPYAFLDDAPLEERRTQAVMARRWHDPQSASDLGRLDPDAIARVQAQAWPDPADAEELHDALLWLGCLTQEEAAATPEWRDWLAALAQDGRITKLVIAGLDPAIHPLCKDSMRNGWTPGSSPGVTAGGEASLWIPAERLTQFRAVWPHARLAPAIAAPPGHDGTVWSCDQALVEILRGRLEGLGPVTATALAAPLGLEGAALAAPLAALEAEGTILRGNFVPGVNDTQWCARRLLARIHHATIRRLRAEIEPVAARDFLRFLLAWQHVADDARLEGEAALPVALAALEGFEAPAAAWETEILPARVKGYEPAWLDRTCLAGRTAWARLTPPAAAGGNGAARPATPVRSTPIALLDRRRAPLWLALAPAGGAGGGAGAADAARPQASPRAQSVLDCLTAHGALFFDELAEAARLLRPHAEEALAELVALGLVTSDSFGGMRALLVPSGKRKPLNGARRRGRVLPFDMASGGRWSLLRKSGGRFSERESDQTENHLLRRPAAPAGDTDTRAATAEHVARTLLARYGVVFPRLIAREGAWLPPWRDLLRVFRRLEARGEIRGGRFVAGFAGEQYALPEAVGLLREMRRRAGGGTWVSLSAADPLNLIGILTPGARLPALTGNRILYRDGLPAAALSGGKVELLMELDRSTQWEAEKRLLRSAARGAMAELG